MQPSDVSNFYEMLAQFWLVFGSPGVLQQMESVELHAMSRFLSDVDGNTFSFVRLLLQKMNDF